MALLLEGRKSVRPPRKRISNFGVTHPNPTDSLVSHFLIAKKTNEKKMHKKIKPTVR